MASKFGRSNRDTTWPGSDGFEADVPLESPKHHPKLDIEEPSAKRTRSVSPSPSPMKAPQPHENRGRVQLAFVKEGSPWESYQEDWRLGRRSTVTIAYKKSKQEGIYTVRGLAESETIKKVKMIRYLHHKNLLPILEVFSSQQGIFLISPYMDVSLERINGSPRYFRESQLAELSREILCGICYLASQGWTHGNINCSNILLSLKNAGETKISEVKISGIECCKKRGRGDAGRIDSKALGIVMMKVMEKDSQPKGTFGLQHPERWSEDAVEFLSMTQVSTPEKLAEHKFVADFKRYGSLVRLIAFTNVAAFGGFYNYEKSAELF